MTRSAAVISTCLFFNTALAGFLKKRRYFDLIDTFVQPFSRLDPATIGRRFQVFFMFSQEIIGNQLLDIGSFWAEYLARYGTVYLIDFEIEGDLAGNPVLVNPLKNDWQDIFTAVGNDLPIRRMKRIESMYFQAMEGLFRAHGHSGFLGELGKLRSFLLGGMEFLEDNPGDASIWSQYFNPCTEFISKVVSLFEGFSYLLSYWPERERVQRLHSGMKRVSKWRRAIDERDVQAIGTYKDTDELLTSIEDDVLKFKV